MRKCLFILFGSCLFIACHHHDDHPVDEQSERTVLVYMAAENNLNSFAASDLEEMKTGSKSLDKRQNLIVYVDQAETTPPYKIFQRPFCRVSKKLFYNFSEKMLVVWNLMSLKKIPLSPCSARKAHNSALKSKNA